LQGYYGFKINENVENCRDAMDLKINEHVDES
jgi:hypothetical protein